MMKIKKKINMSNKSGVSYTISSVIITASTVMLVLIASTFAYQLLEQQRGTSEFNITKNSLMTLDDAIQDIAWSIKGARQTRFSIDYGQLAFYPDNDDLGMNFTIDIEVGGNTISRTYTTGYVEYSIPENSVTFARREPFYILGDEKTIVTDGTESLGCILVYHNSGWVNSLLSYRVRLMEASTITQGEDQTSYVNVWIVKLKISDFSANIDSFDVSSNTYTLSTETVGPFSISDNKNFNMGFQFGEMFQNRNSQETILLNDNSDYVVINFIVSEVELTP